MIYIYPSICGQLLIIRAIDNDEAFNILNKEYQNYNPKIENLEELELNGLSGIIFEILR